MSLELTGKITYIGAVETVGSNNLEKRTVVIETTDSYPTKQACDFLKDKVSVLDNYKVGEEVKIGINIKSNESNGRWFTNILGWKIEKVGSAPVTNNATPEKKTNVFEDDDSDDGLGLPF